MAQNLKRSIKQSIVPCTMLACTMLGAVTVAGSALTLLPPIASPAKAQAAGLASSLTGLMGNASDNALDQLSQPDAFYVDKAIRIGLPGTEGKLLAKGLRFGDKLGLTNNLTKSMNDAAGLAAKEAKPIFRNAIDNIRFKDIPSLAAKSNGATAYLQDSAGADLRLKIRPLVQAALGKTGAFDHLSKLGSKGGSLLGAAGLSNDRLTDSVTDQAMKGIFTYMGNEEAKLRKNPLQVGKKIIGILGK